MAEREWTPEFKEEVIEAYEAENPTPETTMDIVKKLAERFEKTANGVRMVLTKGNVYVKKEISRASASSTESGKPKRVNKADAIDNLKKVITSVNKDVDNDICDRLTGKAAVYFAELLV